MESLRWILLVIGVFFVLAIYFFGRRRKSNDSYDVYVEQEDIPEFTARDWDEMDEGVGNVRVVARDVAEDEFSEDLEQDYNEEEIDNISSQVEHFDDESLVSRDPGSIDQSKECLSEASPSDIPDENDSIDKSDTSSDIIVLYILAKPSAFLSGEKINSVARANGFVFGSMNIFHRLDENDQTIFSLANMLEPGNFDPDSIHEMTTSGLTVFMQLSNLRHPSEDFDEMLRVAYHISEMLGASLCNQNRQPFTQADAEYYRNIIAGKENT